MNIKKGLMKNKSGFTLLEIIIVIIIVGVLASLALPRFFTTIEYSKAQEALHALTVLRQAMNRCYLFDSDFTSCTLAALAVEDPGTLPNAEFTYAVASGAATFTITGEKNTNPGGGATIAIDQDGVKTGTGIYANIR